MIQIDNPEAEQAIQQLARHLGIEPADVVAMAVQHELERLDQNRKAFLDEVSRAADAVRSHFPLEQWLDTDSLYDEQGLPK